VGGRIRDDTGDLVDRSGSHDAQRRGAHDVAEVLAGRLDAEGFVDNAHRVKVPQRGGPSSVGTAAEPSIRCTP